MTLNATFHVVCGQIKLGLRFQRNAIGFCSRSAIHVGYKKTKQNKKQKTKNTFFQVKHNLVLVQHRYSASVSCHRDFYAHLRALRSATITSADTPSSAAWHQAIQHPLRRADDGILRATDATAFIMPRIGETAKNPVTLSEASFTLRLSTPFFSCCVDDVTASF